MRDIHLNLPLPPSANRYWRRSGPRLYRSADAVAYIETVRKIAMIDGVQPLEGCVKLYVAVYMTLRGDLDNRLKVLLDALNGVAYEDDKQVWELHAVRKLDRDDPRVFVAAEPLPAVTESLLPAARARKRRRGSAE